MTEEENGKTDAKKDHASVPENDETPVIDAEIVDEPPHENTDASIDDGVIDATDGLEISDEPTNEDDGASAKAAATPGIFLIIGLAILSVLAFSFWRMQGGPNNEPQKTAINTPLDGLGAEKKSGDIDDPAAPIGQGVNADEKIAASDDARPADPDTPDTELAVAATDGLEAADAANADLIASADQVPGEDQQADEGLVVETINDLADNDAAGGDVAGGDVAAGNLATGDGDALRPDGDTGTQIERVEPFLPPLPGSDKTETADQLANASSEPSVTASASDREVGTAIDAAANDAATDAAASSPANDDGSAIIATDAAGPAAGAEAPVSVAALPVTTDGPVGDAPVAGGPVDANVGDQNNAAPVNAAPVTEAVAAVDSAVAATDGVALDEPDLNTDPSSDEQAEKTAGQLSDQQTVSPSASTNDGEIETIREALLAETTSLTQALEEERQRSAVQADEIASLRDEIANALKLRDENASAEISDLRDRLDKIQAAGDLPGASEVAAAIALSSLQRAADQGGPFEAELAILSKFAPNTEAVTRLEPIAREGAATRVSLKSDFEDYAISALAAAGRADADGVIDRFRARLSSLISVRPASPQQGESPRAIISRAENALERDRIGEAVMELSSLTDEPRAKIDPWLERAKSRAAIEASISELSASLLTQLQE